MIPRIFSKQTYQWLSQIRNNNGGHWYLVHSRLTVQQIERRFKSGVVGRALYQRVGAMVQGPPPVIYMQIAPYQDKFVDCPNGIRMVEVYAFGIEWAVTCCLDDLGITVVRKVSEVEVQRVAQGGR